jgi:flagellar motor switch protein FliG
MSKLEPAHVEQVSIEIARSPSVSAEEQERVIRVFAECSPHTGAGAGSLERAKTLVKKALGADATGTIENIRQSIEAIPFGFLRHVDSQNVLTYIVDEHPQTIALILCHLPASFGAEILAGLPEERRLAVVRRIAMMRRTNPEIIREVERGLERRMSSVVSQSFERAGGAESVAEILNLSDRSTERAILDALGQEDPELVEQIRRLMFVFEDIAKFSDKDLQTILKNVDNAQWATALKGASNDLKEKVLSNMSQRAADLLREEMEFLGAVKLSVVEAKQQEIVDVVRRLEDEGQVESATSGEPEEMVV